MHLITVNPAEMFQALAEPTRVRIVRLLATTGEEACLCELVDSLLEPQYNLSRHLKILRQSGLLTSEKDGRWIYHRLVKREAHLTRLYATVKSLPDADGTFAADGERFLQRVRMRERGRCRVGIQRAEFAVGGS